MYLIPLALGAGILGTLWLGARKLPEKEIFIAGAYPVRRLPPRRYYVRR